MFDLYFKKVYNKITKMKEKEVIKRMKKLALTKEEAKFLKEYGTVEITRNGFDIVIEEDNDTGRGYIITIINPYEKIIIK